MGAHGRRCMGASIPKHLSKNFLPEEAGGAHPFEASRKRLTRRLNRVVKPQAFLQDYRISDLSLYSIRPRILRGKNFLHQRFKTRIATERVEQRINFNVGDVETLMISNALL